MPKKECPIQRFCETTTSRMVVHPSCAYYIATVKQKDIFFTSNACNLYFRAFSKYLWFIDQQQSLGVSNIWLSHVNFPEDHNHCYAELVHWVKTCGLVHAHVLMKKITITPYASMWIDVKHFGKKISQSYSRHLSCIWRTSLDPSHHHNSREQLSWHLKASPQYVLWEEWICTMVVNFWITLQPLCGLVEPLDFGIRLSSCSRWA
jgi:hypothetical protein